MNASPWFNSMTTCLRLSPCTAAYCSYTPTSFYLRLKPLCFNPPGPRHFLQGIAIIHA